jgi:hypothetical protein
VLDGEVAVPGRQSPAAPDALLPVALEGAQETVLPG